MQVYGNIDAIMHTRGRGWWSKMLIFERTYFADGHLVIVGAFEGGLQQQWFDSLNIMLLSQFWEQVRGLGKRPTLQFTHWQISFIYCQWVQNMWKCCKAIILGFGIKCYSRVEPQKLPLLSQAALTWMGNCTFLFCNIQTTIGWAQDGFSKKCLNSFEVIMSIYGHDHNLNATHWWSYKNVYLPHYFDNRIMLETHK